MSDDDDIGIDWGDLGRNVFGGVHTAGSIILPIFGAGALVKPLEGIETSAGLLPDWAKSMPGGPPPGGVIVSAPDYVVVLHVNGTSQVIPAVSQVVVSGGNRFDGNGYTRGEKFGARYSFGYDAPARMDVLEATGRKSTVTDIQRVMFCSGTEGTPTRVAGEEAVMSDEASVVGDSIAGDLDAADAVGDWSDLDIAAAVFTGGAYAPIKAAMDMNSSGHGGNGGGGGAVKVGPASTYVQDPTRSPAYQRALARQVAAQNALANAQARQAAARTGPANVNNTSVPQFNFSTGSMDMNADLSDLGTNILGELGVTVLDYDDDSSSGWTEVLGSDYLLGSDLLGTTTVAAPKAVRGDGKSRHQAILTQGAKVLAQTAASLKLANTSVSKYAGKSHVTLKTVVHGDLLGADAKLLTPRQVAAVQKHTAAATKTAASVSVTKQRVATASASAKALSAALKKSKPLMAKLTVKPPMKTVSVSKMVNRAVGTKPAGAVPVRKNLSMARKASMLNGDVLAQILGEVLGDDPAADDTTTTPTDAGTGGIPGSTAVPPVDIPMPVRGMKLPKELAEIPWLGAVPADGITYKNTAGDPNLGSAGLSQMPLDCFGSAIRFHDSMLDQMRGYILHNTWKFSMGGVNYDPTQGYSSTGVTIPPAANLSAMNQNSINASWGPLIGNPTNPAYAGLQFSQTDGVFFWQSDYAPVAAAYEQDQAIVALNKLAADTFAKTTAADIARVQQENDQAAEDKAKQDAANALAQSASDTQYNVTTQQQNAAAGTLDLQNQANQQQYDAGQAKLDQQNQANQMQFNLQQAALTNRAQTADLDWAIAHPEAAAAAQNQGGGYGGNGGGDGDNGGLFEADSDPIPDNQPQDGGFTSDELSTYSDEGSDAAAMDQE